jgi:hypothetical protein
VTTKAWLAGDQFDLETGATLLTVGDIRVIKEGEKFYLSAPQLDNPPPGKEFHEVARELLVRVNGVGRLMRSDFSPVELTDHYDRDDGVHIVGATASLVARTQISATAIVLDSNGTPKPQPPPVAPAYLALAAKDPDVAEALQILGQPSSPRFADLHRILEIVEHTGLVKSAMQSAGISKASMRRFTHTADHPAASGADSRHSRSSQQPPKNPMTTDEARTMIRQLVSAWMDSL